MNDKNRHLTEKEIIEISNNAMNKTFGHFGLNSINERNKGGLGAFVEENIFGYNANSDDHPDFIDAGIELKVTPIKSNNNGTFSSKERLVLNMINYNSENDKDFEHSSFYTKNKKLLIWFYLFEKGVQKKDFVITNYEIFEFENSVDYKIIKRDWEIIHKKIVCGKAHEISESDTTFLSACTKGSDSSKLTTQPNSDILAKPRAYSFKNGFMTRLYRDLLKSNPEYSRFVSDDEWMNNTLEEIYKDKLSVYLNKSINELKNHFYIKGNPKDLTFKIVQKMLGITGKKASTQEMADAGIKLKTVRLNFNGVPHESMSFPAFDFTELINCSWEESSIREDFCDWKLMFAIFKDDIYGVSRFQGIKFWNVPNSIVDGVIKNMYLNCADLVRNGNAFYYEGAKLLDKFPKERRNSNGVCHIRPHGRNKNDKFRLPIPDKETGITEYTKQSFWFNKQFIENLLEKLD